MASKKPKHRRGTGKPAAKFNAKGRRRSEAVAGEGTGDGGAIDAAAPAEVSGSLGLVESAGVAVEVDRAALLAEADAIAGTLPPLTEAIAPTGAATAAPVDAPGAAPMMPAMSEEEIASKLAPALTRGTHLAGQWLAPNWNITHEEAGSVARDLALVLAYWMPSDSLQPKYAALAMLGLGLFALAETRTDPETGKLRPLKAPRVDNAPDKVSAPPASAEGASLAL